MTERGRNREEKKRAGERGHAEADVVIETGWRIQQLGQVSGQRKAACLSHLGNVTDEGKKRTITGAPLSWKHVGACADNHFLFSSLDHLNTEFQYKTLVVHNINTQQKSGSWTNNILYTESHSCV